jgi:hypothetical protein
MAREVITRLVDDLDGSTAQETVSFAWQGTTYEIDLSKKNASAFEKLLLPYMGSSRRVSGGRRTAAKPAKRAAVSNSDRLAQVRAWAAANGFEVAERGRIAKAVQEAYDAQA